MSLSDTLLMLIHTETFTSIWYWLALGATWAISSHWIAGAPFDMIWNARRGRGRAGEDLTRLVEINARRLTDYQRMAGPAMIGLLAFLLTLLGAIGFGLSSELSQGLFLLLLPVSLTWIMTFRFAARQMRAPLAGEALARALLWLRLKIQFIAMLSIFLTASYATGRLINPHLFP